MSEIPQRFAFIDAGRTFTCCVEPSRTVQADAWWWFHVSTERYERHAPFRAGAGDTPSNVAVRVIAYYDNLLARRAAPYASRWERRTPTAAPAAVAATVAAEQPADEAPAGAA